LTLLGIMGALLVTGSGRHCTARRRLVRWLLLGVAALALAVQVIKYWGQRGCVPVTWRCAAADGRCWASWWPPFRVAPRLRCGPDNLLARRWAVALDDGNCLRWRVTASFGRCLAVYVLSVITTGACTHLQSAAPGAPGHAGSSLAVRDSASARHVYVPTIVGGSDCIQTTDLQATVHVVSMPRSSARFICHETTVVEECPPFKVPDHSSSNWALHLTGISGCPLRSLLLDRP